MNWTSEDDATVRDMAALGYGWKEIALVLPGRTASSVTGYAARNKIKFTGKGSIHHTKKRAPRTEFNKPEAVSEAKQRRCMMCRDSFLSAWAGERFCGSCKKTKTYRHSGSAMA